MDSNSYIIAILDDDPLLIRRLSKILTSEGYNTYAYENLSSFEEYLENNTPDLLILDLYLPDADGFEVLRSIREKDAMPVVMITSDDDDVQKLNGLEKGADDYLVKPFHSAELLARIKNILRRTYGSTVKVVDRTVQNVRFVFDQWCLYDNERYLKRNDDVVVKLTEKETQLLALLLENPGVPASREVLFEKLTGREWSPADRTIDVLIGRLRKKITHSDPNQDIIQSIRSVGYCISVPVKVEAQ